MNEFYSTILNMTIITCFLYKTATQNCKSNYFIATLQNQGTEVFQDSAMSADLVLFQLVPMMDAVLQPWNLDSS